MFYNAAAAYQSSPVNWGLARKRTQFDTQEVGDLLRDRPRNVGQALLDDCARTGVGLSFEGRQYDLCPAYEELGVCFPEGTCKSRLESFLVCHRCRAQPRERANEPVLAVLCREVDVDP
ncbi:MAG: hypothetical protein RL385_4786 [Pseudomonadota bacterium]